MPCTKCGECCEKISLSAPWSRLIDVLNDPEASIRSKTDAAYITQHWSTHPDSPQHYQCDSYDPVAKLCKDHDNRPPICRDFPFYNKEPSMAPIQSYRECGFVSEVIEYLDSQKVQRGEADTSGYEGVEEKVS